MKDAAAKIDDKAGLTNGVYDTMKSDEYQSLLKDMGSDAAKARFSNGLKSLQYLDPVKAQEIRDKFLDQGLGDNLANRIENQDYSEKDLKLAVQDQVKIGLQATYTSYFGVIFTDRAVQNYLKTGKGELPASTKKALDSYKASLKIFTNSIVDSVKDKGHFDLKDVTSRVSDELKAGNSGLKPGVKAGVAGGFKLMMTNGVIPSFAGITTASAAAYALNKNGGDTTEERMAAARQLLITVATSPALTKHAAQILGKVLNKPGIDTMLGLDGQNTQLRETFLKLFPKAADDVPTPSASNNAPGNTNIDPTPANGGPDVADDNMKSWFSDGASESDSRSTLSGGLPGLDSDAPLADTMQSWLADADTDSELSDRITSWLDDPDNVSGLRDDVSDLVDDADRNSALANTLESWLDDASSDSDVADNMRSWLDDAGSGSDADDRTKAVTSWLDDVSSGDVPLRSDNNSSSQLGDLYENANDRISDAQRDRSSSLINHYDEANEQDRARIMTTVDQRLSNQGIDPDTMSTQSKLRFVGSTLNVFANVGDIAGGLLDVALGAMSLDRLSDDPDALGTEKTVAAMQLLGGISISSMAGTNLASMLAGVRLATVLSRVSGTFGVVGAGSGALSMIVMAFMIQDKKEQALEKERQQFRDWDTIGVAADDWGNKLNYVQHARMEYGQKGRYNTLYPDDKPMWEARPEQYKDFTEYVKEHGGISVLWFDKWDEAHPDLAFPDGEIPDPSGRPRLGNPDTSPQGTFNDVRVGTFDDFKTDIDRVDIGSIELADSGRIFFTKDGVEQVVDSRTGGSSLDDDDRQRIYEYLKDLYELVHPDGKLDKNLVGKANDILGKTDDYNNIEDLKRYLDPDLLPLLGKDGGDPGTFADFKKDVDLVDVGSIDIDDQDKNTIIFDKDGKQWKLDKNDHGDLSDSDAEKIFDYVKNLYTLTHLKGPVISATSSKIWTRSTWPQSENSMTANTTSRRVAIGMSLRQSTTLTKSTTSRTISISSTTSPTTTTASWTSRWRRRSMTFSTGPTTITTSTI